MIYLGDCLEVLKRMQPDSVDCIVTDPPYGYSFMGKAWDKAVPKVEIWRECLRVLKPGAFMCVMSAPRSDVQCAMISRLQEAGFRLDFTPIYWTYASGFPKAGNIGKLVDKRLGLERARIAGAGAGTPGNTFPLSDEAISDEAISDEAKALDGSYAGFQPKPAVEVIIVAMKPLSEKTFVDQALTNGKGISWLDDCRVPTGDGKPAWNYPTGPKGRTGNGTWNETNNGFKPIDTEYTAPEQGRFPANLLVSDDVLNDGKIRDSRRPNQLGKVTGTENFAGRRGVRNDPMDFGSYSRYFDLDKWAQTLPFLIVPKASKSEKNAGLEHLPLKKTKMYTGKDRGGTTFRDGVRIDLDTEKLPTRNVHPTVKPLKLMSYLITLFTREGDKVLDPFVGSGTTVLAAKLLNREGIGIEREPEYAEIAKARIEAAETQTTLL